MEQPRADGASPVRTLFSPPPSRRRSPLAAIVSFIAHGLVIGGILVLAATQLVPPDVKIRRSVTFVTMGARPVPDIPVELREPAVELPREAAPEAPKVEVAAMALPKPVVPTPPPPPEPVQAAAPKPKPVVRPEVNVGAFAAASAATKLETRREIRAGGFEAQTAISAAVTTRTSAVWAFDASIQPADARPGTDVRAVKSTGFDPLAAATAPSAASSTTRSVASAGFGAAAAGPTTPVAPRAISNTGFGGAATQTVAARPETVKSAGFEATPVQQAASGPKVVQTGTPVEVLFKPTPAYTDEARKLKIEGDVVLEVEFTAAGQLRIVRVVRGLGYGLDDMAIRAAQQIRFKPATSGGRPIDHRANVNILFRLT